jgi:hypothetical protein
MAPGAFSHSSPRITLVWTCSICAWQRMHVAVMLRGEIDARGSVWGRIRCAL